MISRIEPLAAIVPCYNAGEQLAGVVKGLLGLAGRLILVDDGSTDGAPGALRAEMERHGGQVIAFPSNQGKGFAILAGFAAALEWPEITCVAVVDADGQHDPEELPRLYAAFLEQHTDLVIGSRTFAQEDVPLRSRIGNLFTISLASMLLGVRIPDTQSGYRLHSRRFAESVIQDVPGGRYETEMEILAKAVREGYAIASVPIRTIYEAGNPTSHFHRMRD